MTPLGLDLVDDVVHRLESAGLADVYIQYQEEMEQVLAEMPPVPVEGLDQKDLAALVERVLATLVEHERWLRETARALAAELGAPEAVAFTERFGDETYALLMLMPPQAEAPLIRPREVILVVDTSGSMAGASMDQARAALAVGLDRKSVV